MFSAQTEAAMEFVSLLQKEEIGSTMKRYGFLQILIGFGCSVVSYVAIGVDRAHFEELNYDGNYDMRQLIYGLDIVTIISSAMVSFNI